MSYRLSYVSSVVALVPLAVGCGSDDGSNPAGPDAEPEECVGHTCPETRDVMYLPEGGEVRLEIVRPDRYAPEVRTHAWFASDQDPELREWPRPPENWNVQDPSEACQDLRTGSFFPAGEVNSRTYLDVGDTVTIGSASSDVTLAKRLDTQDDATFTWHDIVYKKHVDPAEVAVGERYDVSLSGGEGLGATTFEGALYLPPDFEPEFPNMDATVVMPAGEDYRFVATEQEYDNLDFTFVGFSDAYGPVGFCVGPPGDITIPADFLEQIPQGGWVQYGIINHSAEEVDGRRIDFVGINCRESRYVVDDAHL